MKMNLIKNIEWNQEHTKLFDTRFYYNVIQLAIQGSWQINTKKLWNLRSTVICWLHPICSKLDSICTCYCHHQNLLSFDFGSLSCCFMLDLKLVTYSLANYFYFDFLAGFLTRPVFNHDLLAPRSHCIDRTACIISCW
jgi:hypothetical protein